MSDLPTMKKAFRTIPSGGGKYEMVFSFASMKDLHDADREWHGFRHATDGATLNQKDTSHE